MRDTIRELSNVNQSAINTLEKSQNLFNDLCKGIQETSILKEKILKVSGQFF